MRMGLRFVLIVDEDGEFWNAQLLSNHAIDRMELPGPAVSPMEAMRHMATLMDREELRRKEIPDA